MTAEVSQTENHDWKNDVLDRKPYADFLTKSLTQQTLSAMSQDSGLTVSLDASWGLGKTFFIRHWAEDLRKIGHPVVVFDAWENDIGDEAAIALMAAIRQELEHWREKLPRTKGLRESINTVATESLASFRKAIIPAAKVVAKGLIKKTTGIVVDDITKAMMSDEDDADDEKTIESATEILEIGLDKLLEKSLDEHIQRSDAIKKFRESTRKLIQLISDNTDAKLPIFVFIDEADRCRPTYAIKLLEEIKHIFGIPGFCYVVATNLDQLQESIKAVYGSGFNSRAYLKRFFEQQLTLPDPDHQAHAKILITDTSILCKRELELGLPQLGYEAREPERTASLIFEAFDLDLRSQKQVIQMADSASAAISEQHPIHLMWLLFLCALNHQHSAEFIDLINRKIEGGNFDSLCKKILKRDVWLDFQTPANSFGRRSTERASSRLSSTLSNYNNWGHIDLKELIDQTAHIDRYSYPDGIIHLIASEIPSAYNPNEAHPSSVSKYGALVRFAGMRR